MDGVHDLGGMQGFGPVVESGSDAPYHERWEPRVFAMTEAAGTAGLFRGSGRALRETMEPVHYLSASYYERWQWSNELRLVAKGTIRAGDVDAWVERLRAGESAPALPDDGQAERLLLDIEQTVTLGRAEATAFRAGDAVRVRRFRSEGHTRCPRYARGAVGVVDAIRGTDALPDDGPSKGSVQPVYAVAFASDALFGATAEPAWTVYLDLWEEYLEPA